MCEWVNLCLISFSGHFCFYLLYLITMCLFYFILFHLLYFILFHYYIFDACLFSNERWNEDG